MSAAGAPDSSIVERLKKMLTEYGTELLKPCDSTEEILRKLDRLEYVLSDTPQEYKKPVEMYLQPSKEALITEELIRHSELDVRVSVACCIGEIIRITAPDEPFEDALMKEFFILANNAFETLSCMSGRAYIKAVCILQTMSNTESCVVMLDLGMYATVGHMFHLFLDGIRANHPHEVFSSMEKLMTVIIHNTVDNDEFLLELVKILLNSLRRENQKASPVSFQLAENVFKNCSAALKAYRSVALTCLDAPIEEYAAVVVSFFHDATQMDKMDHSEKGAGSSANIVPAEGSKKNIVYEGLNEDITEPSSQCRPLSSKHEAPQIAISKEKAKGSVPHSRKRAPRRPVGKEVVGRRIKVWWPLDKKYYKGKITCFDQKYKEHQVEYDDGELELLDLTRERWRLLKDGSSSAPKQESGAPPSSSGAK